LPAAARLAGLRLDSTRSAEDYPRGYKVQLSLDGASWNPPAAEGAGAGAITEIAFEPATAKFVRITQTGAIDGKFWSIHELQVLRAN